MSRYVPRHLETGRKDGTVTKEHAHALEYAGPQSYSTEKPEHGGKDTARRGIGDEISGAADAFDYLNMAVFSRNGSDAFEEISELQSGDTTEIWLKDVLKIQSGDTSEIKLRESQGRISGDTLEINPLDTSEIAFEREFEGEPVIGAFENAYEDADDVPYAESEESGGEKPVSRAAELYMYVQTVLESIVAAFLILTFILSISMVIGSSMEPTLLENDRVVIMRLFYKPSYGDIIAVWAEGLPNRETGGKGEMIVKRVIGLEGDVIDIDRETGTVYRNGVPLDEDYIKESINQDNLGNAEYPVTVEENTVFVLGDNRNHSTDSRYVENSHTDYYVGCIDLRYIMGKAVFRIYPFDRVGLL